jgi:3(or 17)beta-hydroxysteroid dehydrogenase
LPRLENKTVLISGGASGIGAATARQVVQEGGRAVLADRDAAAGTTFAAELGEQALFTPLEVTDEASWQAAVAASLEAFGALHGLLNAAGVGAASDIETCTMEEWRRVNDINSLGTFLGCKSAIAAMRQSGGGSIVNISSVLGLRGAVHPGYIDTPMIAPRLDASVGNMSGRQWLEELHPLGRLGKAEEVASMIVFLLSDESTFSTGSEFVCDGGLTA